MHTLTHTRVTPVSPEERLVALKAKIFKGAESEIINSLLYRDKWLPFYAKYYSKELTGPLAQRLAKEKFHSVLEELIMDTPSEIARAFQALLQKQVCTEYVSFLQDIHCSYKSKSVQEIYNQYIAPSAPQQINIASHIASQIRRDLAQIPLISRDLSPQTVQPNFRCYGPTEAVDKTAAANTLRINMDILTLISKLAGKKGADATLSPSSKLKKDAILAIRNEAQQCMERGELINFPKLAYQYGLRTQTETSISFKACSVLRASQTSKFAHLYDEIQAIYQKERHARETPLSVVRQILPCLIDRSGCTSPLKFSAEQTFKFGEPVRRLELKSASQASTKKAMPK